MSLYDTTTDPSMKQSLIGIYVRNGERPAVDKLLAIVKGEENLSRAPQRDLAAGAVGRSAHQGGVDGHRRETGSVSSEDWNEATGMSRR